MTDTTHETEIDWKAAAALAEKLGLHARGLIAKRDPEAIRAWARRAARDHDVHSANIPRAATYFELAVLMPNRKRSTMQPEPHVETVESMELELRRVADGHIVPHQRPRDRAGTDERDRERLVELVDTEALHADQRQGVPFASAWTTLGGDGRYPSDRHRDPGERERRRDRRPS